MIIGGKYRHTYTPTASDITPLYRLTPNALLMYFQDSFARLMTMHGVAAFDIVKQRRMWVITEVQIDVQPTVAFWSEDFTVELWVSELSALRIYCDFRIVRRDNEALLASGTSQWNQAAGGDGLPEGSADGGAGADDGQPQEGAFPEGAGL